VVEDADEAEWVYKERRRAWKDTARLEPIILAGAGAAYCWEWCPVVVTHSKCKG
jgi:hypothetical protein